MRRQLRSSFGRHEHVPIRIAEKSTAGIGTARSIVVVQRQHADGDHVVAVVCQYGLTRGVAQQTLSKTVPKSRALASPVCDVADDTHRKGSIDGQYFFGINTDLALARHDRPIDLVVVLPGFDLGDVRYLVRLVLDG